MRVFVVDQHVIYRRGLTACLYGADGVDTVDDAGSVREAWLSSALPLADVVVVDQALPGVHDFMRQLGEATSARTVVCAESCDEGEVLAAVAAGAVGYLRKDSLTAEGLLAAVHAAATGAGVMAPEVLGALMRGVSRASKEVLEPRGLSLTRLSTREQEVLRLVADGHAIREVAALLSYSERTIKNVIHDVVTKLNVRTRAQAVAYAVREGLI